MSVWTPEFQRESNQGCRIVHFGGSVQVENTQEKDAAKILQLFYPRLRQH